MRNTIKFFGTGTILMGLLLFEIGAQAFEQSPGQKDDLILDLNSENWKSEYQINVEYSSDSILKIRVRTHSSCHAFPPEIEILNSNEICGIDSIMRDIESSKKEYSIYQLEFMRNSSEKEQCLIVIGDALGARKTLIKW